LRITNEDIKSYERDQRERIDRRYLTSGRKLTFMNGGGMVYISPLAETPLQAGEKNPPRVCNRFTGYEPWHMRLVLTGISRGWI
jgi:hypothetical protein